MANSTAKQPNLLDMLNAASAGDPLAGTGSATSVPAPLMPALAPSGEAYAKSVAPPSGPTLGTEAQFRAPANAAATQPATEDNSILGDDGTLHLPARTSENTFDPSLHSEPHQGFLAKLGQFAKGAAGLDGPLDTPGQKGAAFSNILGRVGNSLALAAGTPEQKQIAEEQQQLPLKLAQIRNEQEYRRAVTANNAAKTNIAAKTEEDKYAAGDEAMGLPPGTSRMTAQAAQQNADSNEKLRNAHARQLEAQLNGEVIVTPEAAHAAGDESLANQKLGALAYQQRITNPINNQLKAAGGTKTVDLGADGVWGYNPLLGRTTRLGDSPSVARSDAMLKRTQIPETDDQGNTVAYLNPQTHTRTSVASIGGAGGENGVIPPKPTSSMLTQGQMAQTIQAQVPALKKEIADLGDKIGATGGRWNDFWVKKAGANDPAYAGVDQDLQLYATAIGKAHFGASMPEGFVKDMMRDFGMAQSPEDLQARIDHAEGWVSGYAARIGGNMPKTPSTSKGGAGLYLFPDGTHRNVNATQVANLPKGATKVQ